MSETPRLGHEPVQMRRVFPEADDGGSPFVGGLMQRGDFYWDTRGGKRTLVLALPCKNKYRVDTWLYSRWTIDHKNHCDAQWSWDGDEEKPTLSPSLHAVGIWHGWVQQGILRES